jgi:hypothetical protein
LRFCSEDCELLAVSHVDEVFTLVPDACYKIERTWTVLNWCRYNPNGTCIYVPNPEPNATVNSPANLPGPTVSELGTLAPWAPTVVAIAPGQASTNYSTFWDANANCYKYKQIIKIFDTQDPTVDCPASPVEFCDVTPNNAQLWNEMYWWDGVISSHDMCEGPVDLTITATDACSGSDININYLLFLDLDGDGTMETVVNSRTLGIAGLGWNNVKFGNLNTPNYGGGTNRAFDERPVPGNQKYGFALQTTVNGANKTASVRWNTQQNQTTYTVPELPYGTHKIKWFIEDNCGNEKICEYTFVVKDCKKPTVVCLNGLSVNIMPTQMITLWASDFLQYTEDNCTPVADLRIAIRKSGTGTGFPVDGNGNPITQVTFTCAELGTQLVELWSRDLAGNADFCETYVIVQDNMGNCGTNATIAGALQTNAQLGVEDATVQLEGSSNGTPMIDEDQTDVDGAYAFSNAIPFLSSYTVTPSLDNDHLNGVSTYDLVLISKHILGAEPLNTPYKLIAADANKSGTITTFDIVEIRKLILGIYSELPQNTSWRFVDKTQSFTNPSNPFLDVIREDITVAQIQNSELDDNFVGVKVGDVNESATPNQLAASDDRTVGTLLFDVQDRDVKAGEVFDVTFKAAEKVQGYQFTLNLNGLEVVEIVPGAEMSADNFGVFADAITTSFDGAANGEFTVKFRAAQAGQLSQMVNVSNRITRAEAYSAEKMSIALRFNNGSVSTIAGVGFELYQNQPNPFVNKTSIAFNLPEAAEATLTIFDETGRTVMTQKGQYAKGYNVVTLDRAQIGNAGMLYYKLETSTDSATKKMIQTK